MAWTAKAGGATMYVTGGFNTAALPENARNPAQMPIDPPRKAVRRGVLIPAVVLVLMLTASLFDGFRALGDQHLEDAGNRAIAAFAIARTINGVISVIQEVEVGVSAVLIQTGFQPGQILDPLNDLIERFSNAALIAATILWSLKILGELLVLPWVPLTLLALLILRLFLEPCTGCADLNQLLMRAVRIGIVVWGFAALTPWVIDGIHHSDVIQSHYQHATAEMESASHQLEVFGDPENTWNIDVDKVRESLSEIQGMADRLSEQAIIVLAVFVFEVLLIPLGIFWITSKVILSPRPF